MRRAIVPVAAVATVATVAVAAVAATALTRDDDADASDKPPRATDTAQAVRTDLVEEVSYNATLGRLAGDPVTARTEGTITQVAVPGDMVGNGDVAYSVDGEPVVALIGDTPAYRDLAAYPDPDELDATSEGVVTWLPDPGTTIAAGDVAFEIDGEPVIAIEGDVPAYRDLARGSSNLTGPDVTQLEQNLEALGLAEEYGVTVDDEFTWATERAVKALQESVGLDDDGALSLAEYVVIPGPTDVVELAAEVGDRVARGEPMVRVDDGEPLSGSDVAQLDAALAELGYLDSDLADDVFDQATEAALRELQADLGMEVDGQLGLHEVLFLPAPIRVAAVTAPLGTVVSPGTAVFDVNGEDTIVSFDLPAGRQGTIDEGQSVSVRLPNGTRVDGTVTSVATVATMNDTDAVFEIEVGIADSDAVAGLDEAPVTVYAVADSVSDVVAVPVAALVVPRDGGYAVELVTGDTTRLVAVEPGFFADGWVEVGGEVDSGDTVVVP